MLSSPVFLLAALPSSFAIIQGEVPACSSKEQLITFNGEAKYDFVVDPMSMFSSTLPEADEKFIEACGSNGGKMQFFDHRMKGDSGEDLRAIMCMYGPEEARGVILTISATHGVEGYAGSYAQIAAMSNSTAYPLPKNYRAIHVHMINPYGASYILKENEDNADVLKNYARLYEEDFETPIAEEFIDGLGMCSLGTEEGQAAAQQHVIGMNVKYGADGLNEGLRLGQGTRPIGIAYYGAHKSWSAAVLEFIAATYMAKNLDHILLIDWHTAVGPYGDWTILGIGEDSQSHFEKWVEVVSEGVHVLPMTVPSGSEQHFEFVRKYTNASITRALIEAGTYPAADYEIYFVLNLYCRYIEGGWTSPTCQFTRSQVLEFFYPQKEDWRNLTHQNFGPMWSAILTGLSNHGVAKDANISGGSDHLSNEESSAMFLIPNSAAWSTIIMTSLFVFVNMN